MIDVNGKGVDVRHTKLMCRCKSVSEHISDAACNREM